MEYTVKKTNAAPELSEGYDSPAWNRANELGIALFHPKSSEHRPRVRARLLHDDTAIYVQFNVSDRYVRCTRTDYQSMVCNDSCVEFFVQPKPDKGYFNFEVNAVGTLLLSYVEDPARTPDGFAKFTRSPWSVGKCVQIYHSLEGIIYPEWSHDVNWTVAYAIPRELFEVYVGPVGTLAGQTWRANFYKCGDETSHPHWAYWAPIGETLNFHQPEFFAPIHFE